MTCPACNDTGCRELPTPDGLEPYPCPCCQPWRQGFSGEYVQRGGRRIYIIEPAAPGVPAIYNGWPTAAQQVN